MHVHIHQLAVTQHQGQTPQYLAITEFDLPAGLLIITTSQQHACHPLYYNIVTSCSMTLSVYYSNESFFNRSSNNITVHNIKGLYISP